MIFQRHFPGWSSINSMGEVFGKIHDEQPKQRSKAIYKIDVQMLITMCRHPLLWFTLADNGALGNIIIYTINIGISMMDDIMFLFPEIGTCCITLNPMPLKIKPSKAHNKIAGRVPNPVFTKINRQYEVMAIPTRIIVLENNLQSPVFFWPVLAKYSSTAVLRLW